MQTKHIAHALARLVRFSYISTLVHEQDPLRRVGQAGEDVARVLRAVRVELEHRPRGLVRVRFRVRVRARVRVRVS